MVRWLQFCKCFSWIIQQSINKDGIDKVGVTEAGRLIVIEVELWWSSPSLSLTTLTSELWWLWSKLWIPQQTAWEYCFATSPLLLSFQESKAIIASPGPCYWQRRDVENCDNWHLQVDRWNHYIWRLVISINFIHNRDHLKTFMASLH